MAYNTLDITTDENIMIIRLNRPDNMNAFTVEMGEEVINALDTADADDNIRAVIFTGNGRAFCAGMDLSDRW